MDFFFTMFSNLPPLCRFFNHLNVQQRGNKKNSHFYFLHFCLLQKPVIMIIPECLCTPPWLEQTQKIISTEHTGITAVHICQCKDCCLISRFAGFNMTKTMRPHATRGRLALPLMSEVSLYNRYKLSMITHKVFECVVELCSCLQPPPDE